MPNLTLYDRLLGCFIARGDDPEYVDDGLFRDLDEREKLRQSILENLQMVLRSRQKSLQTLPDFGIPDLITTLHQKGSLDAFGPDIRTAIMKYEPRIADVEILEEPKQQMQNMMVSIRMRIIIKGNQESDILLTEFSSTGWTKVVIEKESKKS